jgi:hypothetical protein
VEHVAIVVELAQIGPVVAPHGDPLHLHCASPACPAHA